MALEFANAHDAGEGAATGAMWRQQDYAWTHSTPVEGFFVVLTIVIVPVAIVRWLRRLRSISFVADDERRRDVNA
ncbi:MAG TPA: hypothetical protein VN802_04850 [Stellaceae bacterium]|nr:hypothetical protein [Stellaceae bacterium]